jgi:virginiamycin B lyase
MRTRTLLLLTTALAAPSLGAAQKVELQEWTVPWPDTRPRDPYVDPSGRVWFVGQEGNYIAYLEPKDGTFKRFEIEPGTHPHNLIVDRDGFVWYAGNRNARIGRLDPKTGAVRIIAMPDSAARDPHTLIFDKAGQHIWFTMQGGNRIGRLHVSSGKVDVIKVPTERSRPYGIVLDSKGQPWVNLFGSNKLALVNPSTLQLQEIDLPRAAARSRRIGITRDDAVWYVDYAGGQLGRYDVSSKTFEEWPLPGGTASRPYAMAVDDKDRVWLVETGVQPNNFLGFDPKTKRFFATSPIASGGGTVRHMYFHPPTREIWFGTDRGTIGRAKLP